MSIRDYFAEMYVSGILADEGWNIYFPRRDMGFDFIITKEIDSSIIIRPVQVKGKYPTAMKGSINIKYRGYYPTAIKRMINKQSEIKVSKKTVNRSSNPYGYIGSLKQMHEEMVLAIPYFNLGVSTHPVCTAFMPQSRIKKTKKDYRCLPASFSKGNSVPRKTYKKFFDASGVKLLESLDFKKM